MLHFPATFSTPERTGEGASSPLRGNCYESPFSLSHTCTFWALPLTDGLDHGGGLVEKATVGNGGQVHRVGLLLTAHHLQARRLCKRGDQSVMGSCPSPPATQGSWVSPISAQGASHRLHPKFPPQHSWGARNSAGIQIQGCLGVIPHPESSPKPFPKH